MLDLTYLYYMANGYYWGRIFSLPTLLLPTLLYNGVYSRDTLWALERDKEKDFHSKTKQANQSSWLSFLPFNISFIHTSSIQLGKLIKHPIHPKPLLQQGAEAADHKGIPVIYYPPPWSPPVPATTSSPVGAGYGRRLRRTWPSPSLPWLGLLWWWPCSALPLGKKALNFFKNKP